MHASGGATNMADSASRLDGDCPTCFAHPPHELDFLMIEEDALIEEAHVAKCLDAKHDAGAGDPIHFSCF